MKRSKTKHILVIRLSAMGDAAMTIPVLLAFTQRYPEVKITVLSRAFFAPIFAAIPNVNFVVADVTGEHKGILGLWKLFKSVKALNIDAVADLHNVLRAQLLGVFFRFSGIKVRQVNKGRKAKKALTRAENKVFVQLKSTHQRYVDVFNKLGFPFELDTTSILAKKELSEISNKFSISNTKKWIGIAPFAAFKGKMYPIDLMKTVLTKLNNSDKYKLLLFGGGTEEKLKLQEIKNNYSADVEVVDGLSFEEELVLIANLDLMLAMDSGNAHLAANYGLPVVTLWGVTHPFAGFYPYNQPITNALLADKKRYPLLPTSVYGNKFPEGYENVMRSIAPEDVVTKIEELLIK